MAHRGGTDQLIGFHFLENRDRVLVHFRNIQYAELPGFPGQENILRHRPFGQEVELPHASAVGAGESSHTLAVTYTRGRAR